MMVEKKFTLEERIQLYNQAGAVSNYFSKIRLVLPEIKTNTKNSQIRIPRYNKGRLYLTRPRCGSLRVYAIEHEDSELLMTGENTLNHLEFIYFKDYFGVKRLRMVTNSNIPYEVSYSHHDNVIEQLKQRGNFDNDKSTIDTLSTEYVRGLWCITYICDNMNHEIKFPSYHGRNLINNELLRNSKGIQLISRTETASKKNSYGKRRISYVKYILEKDKLNFLMHVRKPTMNILRQLTLDKGLYRDCIKNQGQFRLKKSAVSSE
jgi:hypothetical protein